MLSKLLKKLFGTRNQRLLKGYQQIVRQINRLEPTLQALTDEALRAKTQEFKDRLAKGETLATLLPEAFAVVRETSRRTLGMRPFDVQLIGGIVLHEGKIAEMRTGEGKTLSATMPAYLHALSGKGVHIVTVNDYLAKRDAQWMEPIYNFLGMQVGVNVPDMSLEEKKQAYTRDIVYGTNNEFGFDYLRDNMVFHLEQRVQRDLYYAIVDEVDSILIDEARTPLIISGQAEESSDLYQKIDKIIPLLQLQAVPDEPGLVVSSQEQGDFTVDEKNRQVHLTEQGHQHVESLLVEKGLLRAGESLYHVSNIGLMHYLQAALKAHRLFQRDVHYIVKNDEVIIVDEHTGRLMQGRRWSDGLHQAVEAKEGARIQVENQTLATITFQNYFRLYEQLAGMTGTADTEAFELQKIYGLEVVVIPTNKLMRREDAPDQIYLTAEAKFKAIISEIKKRHTMGQPVLVGTASIEASELVSRLLQKEKIPHEVLNAKQHAREAKIIAEAGRLHAVTIATNMAGRGTDIVLGGNLAVELAELDNPTPEMVESHTSKWQMSHDAVVAVGGLHILGTERHESRRIDNQLRGRAGRQGDPGSSQFYLSMEDNLLRIFAADRMSGMMRRLGVTENDVIQHPWISRAIENAQRRVENLNFDMRKQLLEYDDVANDQRQVIYQQRFQLLQAEDIQGAIDNMREEVVVDLVKLFIPLQTLPEEWDVTGLEQQLAEDFGLTIDMDAWLEKDDSLNEDTLAPRLLNMLTRAYQVKTQPIADDMRQIEKSITLQILDHHWKEHLAAMDHLRRGIHLRGYAQKNPAQEFKRESFDLFSNMLKKVKYEVVATLSKFEVAGAQDAQDLLPPEPLQPTLQYQHGPATVLESPTADEPVSSGRMPIRSSRVGRNEMCPCGSQKKYKQCHGKLEG